MPSESYVNVVLYPHLSSESISKYLIYNLPTIVWLSIWHIILNISSDQYKFQPISAVLFYLQLVLCHDWHTPYNLSYWWKDKNTFHKRGRGFWVIFCYKPKPYCDALGQGYKTQYITEIIELTDNTQALAIIPLKTEGDKVDSGRGFSYRPARLSSLGLWIWPLFS